MSEKDLEKLREDVDNGFSYFEGYALEELTTDKKYYVEAFMKYIVYLEHELKDCQIIIKKYE